MADLRTDLAEVAGAMPGIVSVYLFGSVAEGREHAESDVDALNDLDPVEQFADVVASIERDGR